MHCIEATRAKKVFADSPRPPNPDPCQVIILAMELLLEGGNDVNQRAAMTAMCILWATAFRETFNFCHYVAMHRAWGLLDQASYLGFHHEIPPNILQAQIDISCTSKNGETSTRTHKHLREVEQNSRLACGYGDSRFPLVITIGKLR